MTNSYTERWGKVKSHAFRFYGWLWGWRGEEVLVSVTCLREEKTLVYVACLGEEKMQARSQRNLAFEVFVLGLSFLGP